MVKLSLLGLLLNAARGCEVIDLQRTLGDIIRKFYCPFFLSF